MRSNQFNRRGCAGPELQRIGNRLVDRKLYVPGHASLQLAAVIAVVVAAASGVKPKQIDDASVAVNQ